MNTTNNTNIDPRTPISIILSTLALTLTVACGPLPEAEPDPADATVAAKDAWTPPPDAGTPPPDAGTPVVPGIQFQPVRPNAMLLVDRSGSMGEPGACSEATCPSKWSQLLSLGPYLEQVEAGARLGLSIFPSHDACGSSAPLVPISDAPGAASRILTALSSLRPNGKTPVASAIRALTAGAGLDDPDRDNVVIVLTDGQPNCGCNGDLACERTLAVQAVQAFMGRNLPNYLYVIGFGASAASQAGETLDAMALAAGAQRPAPGQPAYYQADTIEDLIARLYAVTVQVQPCEYILDDTPPADRLIVWLDGEDVSPCTTAGTCDRGYRYDPAASSVSLHGETCATLRDGEPHEIWFDERPE
jgi:hypothetical protein